jgi:hypothetical protein
MPWRARSRWRLSFSTTSRSTRRLRPSWRRRLPAALLDCGALSTAAFVEALQPSVETGRAAKVASGALAGIADRARARALFDELDVDALLAPAGEAQAILRSTLACKTRRCEARRLTSQPKTKASEPAKPASRSSSRWNRQLQL